MKRAQEMLLEQVLRIYRACWHMPWARAAWHYCSQYQYSILATLNSQSHREASTCCWMAAQIKTTPVHLDRVLTLQFPAMEARRPQETILDWVESCPPWHSSNAGAGWWCWVGCACWALLWRMDRCPLGGREGTSPWRGVRGDLYDGDRFGAWVSTRRE